MRVWFLARESEPFSPPTLADRPLGGSETALYYVARGLSRAGHDVTVLNHCGADAGVYEGVRYLDLRRQQEQWWPEAHQRSPDVLVLFRRMLDVTSRIPAHRRVFWAHDFQGVSRDYPRSRAGRWLAIRWRKTTGPLFYRRVDRIFVVSRFLGQVFEALFGVPPDQITVMPNGVDSALFQSAATLSSEEDVQRKPFRFVYTSVPERGLAQLMRDIFPRIRAVHPEATLHVYSYRPLDPVRPLVTPGVFLEGGASKARLAGELARSSLMLYPSNFEELGAIAVLEGMMAGTPPITSALGVLPELTGERQRGIAVPGEPGSLAFAGRFVEETLALLADPPRLERMRKAARDYVLHHHTWDSIASRWDSVLRELLRSGPATGRYRSSVPAAVHSSGLPPVPR